MSNFEIKYAPKCLGDVVFPSAHARQVVDDIVTHKTFRHVIFDGNFGTGKSTLLKLIPEAVFANEFCVDSIEMDGYDCSSVAIVRTRMRGFVNRAFLTDIDVKFMIVDEFDGMSPKAQAALRGVLTDANAQKTFFLFATNSYYALDAGVRSRCTHVKMDDFDPKLWLPRLHKILADEGVTGIGDDLLKRLIVSSKGQYRELLRKLETVVIKANSAPQQTPTSPDSTTQTLTS